MGTWARRVIICVRGFWAHCSGPAVLVAVALVKAAAVCIRLESCWNSSSQVPSFHFEKDFFSLSLPFAFTTHMSLHTSGLFTSTTLSLLERRGALYSPTLSLLERRGALHPTILSLLERRGALYSPILSLLERRGALHPTILSLPGEKGSILLYHPVPAGEKGEHSTPPPCPC
jgi:hypothetical protein